jgi:hypothetical protein
MIDPSAPSLYQEALNELQAFTASARASSGELYRGRFAQIFFGLKYWQQSVPSARSGQYIDSGTLQGMLDDLYAKATRPATQSVAIIFEGTHLPRTGLTVPGKGPQNTWRNNFRLQKGIGCYADANELDSITFLNESRADCRHLVPATPGSLRGAQCALAVAGPRYRGEDHRKWLKIDPAGEGFAAVDLMLTANFAPWIAPAGHRIPALPLVVALYHDSEPALSVGARATGLDLADFASDFNLSPTEFDVYIDQDPANAHNAALLGGAWGLTYTPFSPASMVPATAPGGVPPVARPRGPRRTPGPRPIPTPVLTPTVVTPPVTTAWWDAEQLVAEHLTAIGWTVYHVSRQQLGYDLIAERGARTIFIEVKSSSGYCTPNLTAREWQQANTLADRYVLAVIENFDPAGANSIYWVPDPATNCVANARTTVAYAIPRASWTRATVATI